MVAGGPAKFKAPLKVGVEEEVEDTSPSSNTAKVVSLYPLPEREMSIENLLVRVHWIIEMTVVERLCAMEV